MNGISEWIWRSRRIRINDFSYFRKEFKAAGELVSAQLYVSAHHYVQVYINGVRIGGYGTPAPTNPWKRKLFMEHDISDQLQTGTNCITADAHYLGGGGQNYVDGLPGFRLELHLAYADGKKRIVKSDTSWTTLVDMPHRIGTLYQQNRRVSAIEDYDARKWDEAWRYAGWNSTLPTAKAKKARIGKEEWPMARQAIPEGAIGEELPLRKLELHAGSWNETDRPQVFDAGVIVSGWPKLRLKGIEGVTVRMRYSEDLDDWGRVKHNVCNEDSDHYYDQYTMRGDTLEEWQPDFSYKAFRYVEITGYPLSIETENELIVCLAYTDIDYTGGFRCSDDHLNSLYEACIRTQKNNTLGQTVDCPHREQAQYIADTDLQAETLFYNFNALTVIEKTLSDFADAQLEDGTFPFVAPSNYDNPDFTLQIPEWDLHYATLLWKLYETSGNGSLLHTYHAPLRRMVDYFISRLDPAIGLVPLDKGWHISDWPYPSVDHEGEFLTVQQIKLLQAIRIVAETAAFVGETELSASYRQSAEQLASNILKHLYDQPLGRVKDCYRSKRAHQGVTAIALYADVIPSSDREKAIAFVADMPWECRTVLSLPLLRMLFENDREAEAFAILNRREYPGWGYMIAQGARTMWEGWEDIESHSHAWNGYPARLLQEYVVGIQSEAPGFRKAVIRPYFPDSLTFAEAKVWTVQGDLYVRWEKLPGGGIRMKANIPAAIDARMEISLPQRKVVMEIGPGIHDMKLE
ncbi:alpha-L-rhamnosidase [Paenibacillus sp. FSL H8-0548]|uniref:alpha-L-rhamnosidase n=1 Tax=Paenibacillus sp. FSL H8-0548 TaxID=1920422 RepID=UPI00096DEE09|nr:alpha-L-rhamnosidase [Paenibacillus sp. FSL H8-0548]OMF32270.1 alpha-L-rhamnosidase [Paenibacillus sp. FSL H8-0548]